MNEWMSEWMNEWINEWMNEWIYSASDWFIVAMGDEVWPTFINNNNKLYLHDYNKVLQYCKSHLKFNY